MGISMKTTSGKLLASAALVGTAVAVAGLGTFGTFTDSTSASADVSTGTVDITLGAAEKANVAVVDVLPGDTVEQLVTLSNDGESDLASISLTTASTVINGLDLNKVVSLSIESCSETWTPVAGEPDTCNGTKKSVLTSSPLAVSEKPLSELASLKAGMSDNLKVAATLSKDAGNEYQGAESNIGFVFDALQRSATTT